MKAVLMAFSPKECEKIFSGKKTVDVRKVAPNLETPYKVYVYQTKGKEPLLEVIKDGDDLYGEVYHGETVFVKGCHRGLGKVVGEFVCDYIDKIVPDFQYGYLNYLDIESTCLSIRETQEYGKGKTLCGLHITTPTLYDKPKKLGEFRKPCEYASEHYACYPDNCAWCPWNTVTRPPQSWQYVEELC